MMDSPTLWIKQQVISTVQERAALAIPSFLHSLI